MDTTMLVKEIFINQDVTLVYMPDLKMCDLHVKGDQPYVVHFLKPDVFGQEFATLRKGNNLFTVANDGQTESYFFDEDQLRDIVAEVEDQPTQKRMMSAVKVQGAKPFTRTGPILIPPS